MDLWHHFRQLKLVAESLAFVFQLCKDYLYFKQRINSSSVPSFARFKPQHLNNFLIFSLNSWRPGVKNPFSYSFPGRGLHISTLCKLMDTFTKPLIIQFDHSCFKWLIPTHNRFLNIFCALTWNDLAIYIHLLQIFSHAVNHMTFVRVPIYKSPVERKGT